MGASLPAPGASGSDMGPPVRCGPGRFRGAEGRCHSREGRGAGAGLAGQQRGCRLAARAAGRMDERWRNDMADGCIFCKIVAGELPAKIVREDEETVAFRDINPQAPVHVLVIPRKHIASVNALEASDAALVGRLFLAAKEVAAAEGVAESGYR